ncbi:MAG: ABC transporter permease [Candidatus Bathyarchaeota archaeon]|nr:ABC transporter permease [Candidatus Bathyarchaeota archaeon]
MTSFLVVCKKELYDHLGSKRFLLLFALILGLSFFSAYSAADSVRNQGTAVFLDIFTSSSSFVYIMFMFGPLIGLALGFDAINRERNYGSLSVLLSQPMFRDSIINGKFLAGVSALSLVAVSTVGMMTGIAIPLLGFGPTPDQIVRIVFFTLITILYLSVWLAIGILFSTITKKITTSMIASVSTWFVSAMLMTTIAMILANLIIPTYSTYGGYGMSRTGDDITVYLGDQVLTGDEANDFMDRLEQQNDLQKTLCMISPSLLYQDSALSILSNNGWYSTGVVYYDFAPPEYDMFVNWPHMTTLAAVLIACFALSYIIFLRQEIRVGN